MSALARSLVGSLEEDFRRVEANQRRFVSERVSRKAHRRRANKTARQSRRANRG